MTAEAGERALREAIVRAGARLGRRGLIAAGEGNLSVRLDRRRLLITPAGRRKDELEPDDLVIVGSAPSAPSPAAARRPSSDVMIHRAIYAARPDVSAVIHAHVPAAMALSTAGEAPDPAALPETALLLPRLPFVSFGAPGSRDLARRIAAAMAEPPEPCPGAVILERHGAVAVGGTVDEALDRMELVDVLCRVWRDVLLIRATRA